MAEGYFKYTTTNTIKFQSDVDHRDTFALTICYDFPTNRTDKLMKLNISNTFSLLKIRDRSFIPLHERGSEETELTLMHYKIFKLLCHSIRADETRNIIFPEQSDSLIQSSSKKSKFNDVIVIAISSFLQEKLMKQWEEPVYLSMSSEKDRLYNPHNTLARVTPFINFKLLSSSLDYKVLVKENMPAPYDTQCMHHVDEERIISSNDCFHYCYSSLFMKKYHLFPFDSPRQLNTWNASFEFPILSQAHNLTGREDERIGCIKRCGNDCTQVNYYLTEQPVYRKSNVRTFVISGPDEEILITHSASISFWDLLSVMLNGASFYFSFCPATLLLSHWLWSRVTPARVKPENEVQETEMNQVPALIIQQRDDPDEESTPVLHPQPSVSHANRQVSITYDASRWRQVKIAWTAKG